MDSTTARARADRVLAAEQAERPEPKTLPISPALVAALSEVSAARPSEPSPAPSLPMVLAAIADELSWLQRHYAYRLISKREAAHGVGTVLRMVRRYEEDTPGASESTTLAIETVRSALISWRLT